MAKTSIAPPTDPTDVEAWHAWIAAAPSDQEGGRRLGAALKAGVSAQALTRTGASS